jgi:hypothetical protein
MGIDDDGWSRVVVDSFPMTSIDRQLRLVDVDDVASYFTYDEVLFLVSRWIRCEHGRKILLQYDATDSFIFGSRNDVIVRGGAGRRRLQFTVSSSQYRGKLSTTTKTTTTKKKYFVYLYEISDGKTVFYFLLFFYITTVYFI